MVYILDDSCCFLVLDFTCFPFLLCVSLDCIYIGVL